MIESSLEKLGLSPSEVKVYLHLARNGASYANKISSQAKLNRTNVYEALDRLVSKGIIAFVTKNKVKWFEAKSHDSIFALIKEKEDEMRNTKEDISKEIAELKISIDVNKKSLEATIFTGKKGLRI